MNRLVELIIKYRDTHTIMAAMEGHATACSNDLNACWQTYQQVSIDGTRERAERKVVVDALLGWIQRWRPIVLMVVPGAGENIRRLPPGRGTPDDIVTVASDLITFVQSNPYCEAFRESALADMQPDIETVRAEIRDAVEILPVQTGAREALTQASVRASKIMHHATDVIRAVFGPTSPEYRQFLIRKTTEEEAEAEANVNAGENTPDGGPGNAAGGTPPA